MKFEKRSNSMKNKHEILVIGYSIQAKEPVLSMQKRESDQSLLEMKKRTRKH
jgi:hypothetical protein